MMLRVSIERKLYPGSDEQRAVLQGLSFESAGSEIVALLGPSGCGKTTVLKILAGLDRDIEGEIRWESGKLSKIGAAFQEPRLLPWCTVLENLLLVQPGNADTARALALLDRLGLREFPDRWASQLSLGMARRLAFARALIIEPEVLLLDEAFVSLDPAMIALCHDLLIEACRQRPTLVIFVTHDIDEAIKLADRIFILSPPPSRVVDSVALSTALRDDPAAAEVVRIRLHRHLLAP